MKPKGETKYTGPRTHKFDRATERKVAKLKKEDPRTIVFLSNTFQDKGEAVDTRYVPNSWLPLAVGGFVTFERRKFGEETRFTLTPLGFAAIQMEGQ